VRIPDRLTDSQGFLGGVSRGRLPFFAISVLGLAIGLWGMRGLPALSAPPPGYPSNPILFPARVGPAVVGSSAELRFMAQSRPAGSILEIRSDAGVVHARLTPQVSRVHLAVLLLEGIAFLAVSFLVFAPRAERGPLRDLFWCTLLFGVATMIHGLHFPRSRSVADWLFPAIWIVCVTALPTFFFRMSQTFPRPRRLLERRPLIMRGLWIGTAALIAWQVATAYHYFLSPTPGAWAWLSLPRSIAEFWLVLAVGLGCLTLYRSGRNLDLAREREQTRWLLWGITLGVAPYVLFRAVPRLVGITSTVPPEVDRLFELAIPVAFTFAVVRLQILDIDIIIRRSVITGILAGALASIYLLVGVLLAQRVAAGAPQSLGWIQFLAVALPVLLVTPLRRWVGTWVDRTFFKIQYDYARASLGYSGQIRAASTQEEILDQTRLFLDTELKLDSSCVLARRGAVVLTAATLEAPLDPEAMLVAADTKGAPRRLLAAPGSTTRPDLESPAYPSLLQGAGYSLALPLTAGERTLGALLVGEKKSQRRFIEEDLRLLYAVRSEAEGALERLELVQRAYEEILTGGEETEVKRDPPSRPRPAGPPPIRQERVDLLPLVQDAVAQVEPEATARKIRFDVSVSPAVRPVFGDRAQLFEILVDLLENAARYSPERQAVDITLEPTARGQMIVVRDRGPGIAESERERIFQKLEVGGSSALHAARFCLERMNGTIRAQNHPEGGAMFICTIPGYSEAPRQLTVALTSRSG